MKKAWLIAVMLLAVSVPMSASAQTTVPGGLRIVVHKAARTLEVFDNDKQIKSYTVAIGFSPVGDKEIEGDGRTPEGDFYIFVKNDKSSYYLSLGVSYPSREDAYRGLTKKLITQEQYDAIIDANNRKMMPPQTTPLGGQIYIHGGGAVKDWTLGCVALKNEDMKELFDIAIVGMPVKILP
jgi:murein L,D-transpeptidase YafK